LEAGPTVYPLAAYYFGGFFRFDCEFLSASFNPPL